MELSQNKILNSKFYKVFIFLFSLTFITWWSGIAGASLYAIPSLLLVGFSIYAIIKGQYFLIITKLYNNYKEWISFQKYKKMILAIFALQSFLWFSYVILKYYSFNLFTLDAGYHSNILYNISNGDFFSSVFNMHNLGEHFTLSMSFIALFYKLIPSINWMMGFKIIAYLSSVYLIFLIIKDELKEYQKYWMVFIVFAVMWLFLYRPIINTVRYEFQASCLAPPFILMSFLFLKKEKWIPFVFTMIFLLGFKEHLGSVWIGFGCYKILKNPRNISGYIILMIGVLSIYLIMFEIKSYFRGTTSGYNDVNLIAPFKDIGEKIFYFLIYLLSPLMFLPLIFWKNGIMAMPAIGINLISGVPQMYSSHYHYDDVASTLLIISTIISLKNLNIKFLFEKLKKYKIFQYGTILWLSLFLYYLPYSNLRFIKKVIPTSMHFELINEINNVNKITKNKHIAVQDVLGSHFYRKEIQAYYQGVDCNYDNAFYKNSLPNPLPAYEYIILSAYVSQYGLKDYEKCLEQLNQSNKFIKLGNYKLLDVYQRIQS
tara:strand:+ start:1312 stop:2937 length:1626 start_codon:yes stop_codon:yes gene_type:complete